MRIRQLYLPDTNILLTRFLAEEGVAELTDYMPIEKDGEQPNEIVRMVSVIRGNVSFKMRCQPRFNYAASAHRAEISDHCATFFPADNVCSPMALYSTCCSGTAVSRRNLTVQLASRRNRDLRVRRSCARKGNNLRWSS